MSKTIVAVNAGPRKGWNTDTLITEAARGAESAGAGGALRPVPAGEIHRLHLLLRLQAGEEQGPLRLPGRPDAGAGRHPGGGRADHRLPQLPGRS